MSSSFLDYIILTKSQQFRWSFPVNLDESQGIFTEQGIFRPSIVRQSLILTKIAILAENVDLELDLPRSIPKYNQENPH